MGRETKLDDLVERRICDALRDGHSYEAAARAGGIAEATLHLWRQKGREGEPRYSEFLERIRRANQEAEDRAIQVLKCGMTGEDLKLATDTAWKWLARRRPATWGEQKGDAPPSDEEVRALVEKIRKVGT